jgi:hypothetical protein
LNQKAELPYQLRLADFEIAMQNRLNRRAVAAGLHDERKQLKDNKPMRAVGLNFPRPRGVQHPLPLNQRMRPPARP